MVALLLPSSSFCKSLSFTDYNEESCVFYTNLPLNITPLAGQLNDTQTSFVTEEIAVSRPGKLVFSSDEDIGYLQGERVKALSLPLCQVFTNMILNMKMNVKPSINDTQTKHKCQI